MTGAVREYTKYFDFEVPQFDFPGWHTYYDRNLTMIDQILYLMTGVTTIRGIWRNNTQYIVDDRVLDIDTDEAYACLVTHVSSPVPVTFREERLAHPDRWQFVSIVQSLVGTSITPNTINIGSHVFHTQKGRLFNPGTKILITADVAPTVNQLWGEVTSYDVTTETYAILTVDVQTIEGGGNFSAWHLSVSGERGPQGIPGAPGAPGGVPEAPANSVIHGRRGLDASWQPVSAVTADTITIPASGGIQSTNIQAAIYELDQEKYPKTGGILTGNVIINNNNGQLIFRPPSPSDCGIIWQEADTDPRFNLIASVSTLSCVSYGPALDARTSFYIQDSDGFLKVPNAPASGADVVNKTYADNLYNALNAGKVANTGDTMSGDLTISKVWPALRLNKTVDSNCVVYGLNINRARWGLDLAAASTDNFNVYRFNVNGDFVEAAMTISWAGAVPGAASFSRGVNFYAAVDGSFGTTADAVNNVLTMSSGTYLLSPRSGGGFSNLYIRRNNAEGIVLDGNVNLYGVRTVVQSPSLQVNTNPGVFGCLSCYMQGTGGVGIWNANGRLGLGGTNSSGIPTTLVMTVSVDGNGIEVLSNNAYKTNGGAWLNPASDERVKTVTGDYTNGLAAINALTPKLYTYKGNDTRTEAEGSVPYTNSPHHDAATNGEEFIGLIAQEVEVVMPEMVTQNNAFIDGVAVTDMRGLDTSPLVFALINAVKELTARVQELEALNAATGK